MLFLLLWQCYFCVSDAGAGVLLLFIYHLLKLVSQVSHNVDLEKFPKNVQSARKLILGDSTLFYEYTVCPKCDAIYDYANCIEKSVDGTLISKKCQHSKFPDHTYESHRQPCGATLLQKVRSGLEYKLKPCKVYCYNSLKIAVERLLTRPGFLEKCEQWRNRSKLQDTLTDIYDGKVWNDFQVADGNNFLQQPYSWAVTMNIDWFQPYTHICDSVGAIYLVIQNLPRSIRYKWENMILVGLIPGPKEPKHTINSYLSPLVQELLEFWSGIQIATCKGPKVIRIALTCIACDIPATRKVCGFLGHNATKGCSKCLKEFYRVGNKMICSGFDPSLWPKRSITEHRQVSQQYSTLQSRARQIDLEKEYGVRYSILLELPYFNPIRMAVVDPMHNLFLGTAKYVTQFWIEHDILTKQHLTTIEKIVAAHKIPHSAGRLPTKISSGFAGFSADQWRNWTVVFSAIALRPVLSSQHLQYWLLFVKACTLLCARAITTSKLQQAHEYLRLFCIKFEAINGRESCTPNMHLHLHLSQCLLDYGPLRGFWCYSFERYNGALGHYPTNRKHIEAQLMKKCIMDQSLRSHSASLESPFHELLPKSSETGGCLLSVSPDTITSITKLSAPKISLDMSFVTGLEKLIHPVKEKVFESTLADQLLKLYSILYPQYQVEQFSHFYLKSKRASFCDEIFGSFQSISEKASIIMAYWPTVAGTINHQESLPLSVGRIQYFIEHSVRLTKDGLTTKENHYFAYVLWYTHHAQWDSYGSSCIISHPTLHTPCLFSFLPLSRIYSKCAYGHHSIEINGVTDTVFIASPISFH